MRTSMIANSLYRIASNGRSSARFGTPAGLWRTVSPLAPWVGSALLGVALVVPGLAQPTHQNGLPRAQRHEYRHEIEQLEEAWRTAMVKGDSAALEKLLADD